jgi:hypothetical protein
MPDLLLEHLPPALAHLAAPIPSSSAPVLWIGEERVRETNVGSTVPRISETPRKDGERFDVRGEESAVKLGIEVGSPVKGVRLGKRGGRHDVEGFAEVGRVLVKVHESAVEHKVGFVWAKCQIELKDTM